MTPAAGPVKCLLVDDLEENLLALAALMHRDDVEVLTARSGLEALDLLLAHDVALALVDVQMPEMDGIELAELMRGSARTRHVPIIFVTAGPRDYQRLFRGYDSGAVDFLYKPIDPQVLTNKAEVFFQLFRQRQQLERELRERTEMLHLREMFSAVLGHDLRTPLNAIVTGAHLLGLRGDDPEVVRRVSSQILASSRHMTRMIEDLLDVTRARLAGGIPITPARVDLAPVIARVVEEHRASFPTRRIEVSTAGSLEGDWDDVRLGQVVSNLLGNALRYGDPAEPVTVHADGTRTGDVVVAVTNRGTIPPEIRATLFDPFSGAARSRERQGLGLGLYIAHQVVCSHHGRIDADIREPFVSFRVTVPRQPLESGTAPATRPHRER